MREEDDVRQGEERNGELACRNRQDEALTRAEPRIGEPCRMRLPKRACPAQQLADFQRAHGADSLEETRIG